MNNISANIINKKIILKNIITGFYIFIILNVYFKLIVIYPLRQKNGNGNFKKIIENTYKQYDIPKLYSK
jgi:hypothetical protein